MNSYYEGLETGHWYDGDDGWSMNVENETVSFDFEQQRNDFDYFEYMKGFRDYVKEALESGKYKENEKYLLKSLKCYNLWILDFLSKVRIDENLEMIAGKYLRGKNFWHHFWRNFKERKGNTERKGFLHISFEKGTSFQKTRKLWIYFLRCRKADSIYEIQRLYYSNWILHFKQIWKILLQFFSFEPKRKHSQKLIWKFWFK